MAREELHLKKSTDRPKLEVVTRVKRAPSPRSGTCAKSLQEKIASVESQGQQERTVHAMTPTDSLVREWEDIQTAKPASNSADDVSKLTLKQQRDEPIKPVKALPRGAVGYGVNLQDILNRKKHMQERSASVKIDSSNDDDNSSSNDDDKTKNNVEMKEDKQASESQREEGEDDEKTDKMKKEQRIIAETERESKQNKAQISEKPDTTTGEQQKDKVPQKEEEEKEGQAPIASPSPTNNSWAAWFWSWFSW